LLKSGAAYHDANDPFLSQRPILGGHTMRSFGLKSPHRQTMPPATIAGYSISEA
jgi:hypothetical protein